MSVEEKKAVVEEEIETQEELIAQIQNVLRTKGAGGTSEVNPIRPADFPQYTDEMLNEEVVYFTVDTDYDNPFFSISTNNGVFVASEISYVISRGTIQNGQFVGDVVTTLIGRKLFSEWVPKTSRYVVYKLEPSEGYHLKGWAWSTSPNVNGSTYPGTAQEVVEVFGNAPFMEYPPSNFTTGNQNGSYPKTIVACTLLNAKPKIVVGMFNGCVQLAYLNLNGIDTSYVTDTKYMFYDCSSLKKIDLQSWDMSQVTNMSYMFSNCSALESIDISSWNTPKVTNVTYMFNSCYTAKEIKFPYNPFGNITTAAYLMGNCKAVKEIYINGIDVSSSTTLANMFNGCSNAKKIYISFRNSPAVSCTAQSMFAANYSLERLEIVNLDASNITNLMYWSFSPLTEFYPMQNISVNFPISSSYCYTADSLLRVLNNLADGVSGVTCTLGQNNLKKLTEEQKAIATNKGWVLA